MKNIDQNIEETLNSLDGLQKAEAPVFFHTRVNARLEKKLTSQSSQWLPIQQPVWMIAALILLLTANVFLLANLSNKNANTNNSIAKTSNLQGFASSYGLTTSTEY